MAASSGYNITLYFVCTSRKDPYHLADDRGLVFEVLFWRTGRPRRSGPVTPRPRVASDLLFSENTFSATN